MTATKKVIAEIKGMPDGQVFTVANLEYTGVSYVRLRDILSKLSKEGSIAKIDGTTYAKKRVSAFGIEMPIAEQELLAFIMSENKEEWMLGGLALFHKYGLTAQNPVSITILNNKSTYEKTISKSIGGAGITLKVKRITAPISKFNRKALETLEIIKHHKGMYEVESNEVYKWLYTRITNFKPRMITMMTSLATRYYPKTVSFVLMETFTVVLGKSDIEGKQREAVEKAIEKLRDNLKTKSNWGKRLQIEQFKNQDEK